MLTGNHLLDALTEQDRAALLPGLEHIPLVNEASVYEPNERIETVYFPTSGIISMISAMENGSVEVGTVGREGMAGLPVMLHTDSMPTRAFVQVKGEAMVMPTERFREAMQASPAFSRLLYRYAQALFDQVAQSVACNRLHVLEERCARWVLMTADRVGDTNIHLKHEFLAEMLGVHRPAVTLAARALQRAGLIRYARGVIDVLDRAGLEAASCECYAVVRGSFERLRATGAS
jgi:CRP-like cAMP-binding protein